MNTILYCHCAHAGVIPEGTRRAALAALSASDEAFDAVPDLCGVAASGGPSLSGYARIAACYPRGVRWLLDRAGVDVGGAEVVNLRERSAEAVARAIASPIGGGRTASSSTSEIPGRASSGNPDPGELRVVLVGRAGRDAGDLAELIASLLSRGHRVTRVAEGSAFPPAAGGRRLVLGAIAAPERPPFEGAARGAQEGHEGSGRLDGRGRGDLRDVRGLDNGAVLALVDEAREALGAGPPNGWIPWFPVIDYERCAGCRQCADFCLFGVYAMADDGRVVVENPERCKTNCPACSRLCPEVAILFPKYKAGPLSGDEVPAAPGVGVAQGGPTRVDVAALAGNDLHAALRNRSRPRFSVDASAAPSPTEGAPRACESPLARALDVPLDAVRGLSRADRMLLRERAERMAGSALSRPAPSRPEPSHSTPLNHGTPERPEEAREPS